MTAIRLRPLSICIGDKSLVKVPTHLSVRLRLHEQIKPPLIAEILDPYEVTPDEFAQISYVLFAHVNAAYKCVNESKLSRMLA